MALINCPECNGNLSDKASVCPHCGYPVKDPAEYEYRFTRQTEPSKGAAFMRTIAWLVWGGGMLLAIIAAGIAGGLGTFFALAAGFGISGGFVWAVSMLFEDVHGIHAILNSLQLNRMVKNTEIVRIAPKQKEKAAAVPEKPAEKPAVPEKSAAPEKPVVVETPAAPQETAHSGDYSLNWNEWKCRHCGTANSMGKRLCVNCGKAKE